MAPTEVQNVSYTHQVIQLLEQPNMDHSMLFKNIPVEIQVNRLYLRCTQMPRCRVASRLHTQTKRAEPAHEPETAEAESTPAELIQSLRAYRLAYVQPIVSRRDSCDLSWLLILEPISLQMYS